MSGPVVAQAEHGLVAIEWPKTDIDASFLRPEAHAALLMGAHQAAKRLGLSPNDGGAVVYSVQREAGECLRFVWGDAQVPR